MCGILGMAGDCSTVKHDRAFVQLLQVDSLRGRDSTGIAVVAANNDVDVLKAVGDAYVLTEMRKFDTLANKKRKAIIGHNRFSTVGASTRRNAHPFEFDTLVGVHNGTLEGKYRLDDGNNFQVDSEALYNHIDKNGLKDALSKIGGAWALVWWDKVEQTINFLRNKERPLYLSYGDDAKSVFWASEDWMLDGILSRNEIGHTVPVLLDKDILFSFHIDDYGVLHKPKVSARPGTYVAHVFQNNGTWNNNHLKQGNLTVVKNTPEVKGTGKGTNSKKADKAAGPGFQTGFKSSYVQSRGVLFETLRLVKDKYGAEYIICTDDDNPYAELRLYIHRKDKIRDMIGVSIRGDVSHCVEDKDYGTYFKISPHNWKVVDTEQIKLFKGHKGDFLSKEEWEKLYSTCSWCTSPLIAGESNGLTSEGQCLCPDCANDKDVQAYVKVMPF